MFKYLANHLKLLWNQWSKILFIRVVIFFGPSCTKWSILCASDEGGEVFWYLNGKMYERQIPGLNQHYFNKYETRSFPSLLDPASFGCNTLDVFYKSFSLRVRATRGGTSSCHGVQQFDGTLPVAEFMGDVWQANIHVGYIYFTVATKASIFIAGEGRLCDGRVYISVWNGDCGDVVREIQGASCGIGFVINLFRNT